MDDFNDLENSSKEQLIEKVESLQDEIDLLREEKSKAKSNLMWKVRKLEKDKVSIPTTPFFAARNISVANTWFIPIPSPIK